MHEIVQFIAEKVSDIGYLGIFIMMMIESSFFPFPSEIAMIPAGYLSSTGDMVFGIAFLVGTLGALIGSTINYLIGYKLGGPIIKSLIEKFGKYFFIDLKHYEKAEHFFLNHGSITTFIGRLIPAIRQLISIPAGTFKLNFPRFLIFTSAGAGLWNLILMIIGYVAGQNRALIETYSTQALIITVVLILIIVYFYYQKHKYTTTSKSSIMIFINNDGKLLIQDRTSISKHGEKWGFFGGGINKGEKIKEAMKREIKEELGINLEYSDFKYIGRQIVKMPILSKIAYRYYYTSTVIGSIEEITVLEGDGAKFISLQELKEIDKFIINGKPFEKIIKIIEKLLKQSKTNIKNEQ